MNTIISNKYHSFFHLKYLSFFKGVQPGGGGCMVNPVKILLLPSDFNLCLLPSSVKDCEKAFLSFDANLKFEANLSVIISNIQKAEETAILSISSESSW